MCICTCTQCGSGCESRHGSDKRSNPKGTCHDNNRKPMRPNKNTSGQSNAESEASTTEPTFMRTDTDQHRTQQNQVGIVPSRNRREPVSTRNRNETDHAEDRSRPTPNRPTPTPTRIDANRKSTCGLTYTHATEQKTHAAGK